MKKEEFLKKLEKKLSILNEEERQDIIDEYRDHIDKKMEDGMTEEEAVKDFGDFDTLVKDILKAYKINENYTKTESKLEGTFNIIVDEMVHFFQKLICIISNKKGEDLLRIICKVVLVLFVILLMHIPVWMIRSLGESIFSVMPGFLGHVLSVGWAILIEILYVIVSILVLYVLIKKMVFEDEFMEIIESDTIEEAKVQKKSAKIKQKEPSVVHEKPNYSNAILNLFMFIIKIFVVIFTLPLLSTWLGLVIVFGIMIALLIKGIYLISFFFIFGGLLMIVSSILGIIYHVVWKGDK